MDNPAATSELQTQNTSTASPNSPSQNSMLKTILIIAVFGMLLGSVFLFWQSGRATQTQYPIPSTVQSPQEAISQPQNAMESYQDATHGFAFAYFADAQPERCSAGECASLKKYGIHLDLAAKALSTDYFAKDIGLYAASLCKSTIPTVILTCDPDKIKVERFINAKQISGYKITREKTTKDGNEISIENDTVFGFPLTDPDYFAAVFSVENLDNTPELTEMVNTFNYQK